MPIQRIRLKTSDGECPVHVITPTGLRQWPAIVFYGDAGGIRPAMVEMATRLAETGFVVLLPDVYYRYGSYGPLVPKEVFKVDVGAILGPLMATTSNDKAAEDTGAFLAYLDTRTDVGGSTVGAVGFCMGGGMALAAAATYPTRFGAVASFHGGNLATDSADSPHLLVSNLTAEVYIASASEDESYPPSMAERLESAMTTAKVKYVAETYCGARHGWMVPDFPVFDTDFAERGWKAMSEFFGRRLRA